MATERSLETLRTAVDTVAPRFDDRPSASEIGAHVFVAATLDLALENGADLVASLLDAFATQVRQDAVFTDLDTEEQGTVFRLLAASEFQDLRDAADALLIFTWSATCSEANPQSDQTWATMGYHGSSQGVPNYRRDV